MRRLSLAGAGALVALSLLHLPALAAELTGGCQLQMRSYDEQQQVLDEGTAPGDVGTSEHPLRIDSAGQIDYVFTTPGAFQDSRWSIRIYGLPLITGSDQVPRDEQTVGALSFGPLAPMGRVVGLFHVQGDVWGDGDTRRCQGEGWIHFVGEPIGTLPWLVAVILLLLGLAMLVLTPFRTEPEADGPPPGRPLGVGVGGPPPSAIPTPPLREPPPPRQPPATVDKRSPGGSSLDEDTQDA